MSAPNILVNDARRYAAQIADMPKPDIPRYDRVTTNTDSGGNQTITYWDKRYTCPVHIEYIPAPPIIVTTSHIPSQ